MAVFRLPLWFNKHISFSKLMGSGRNGTFDKVPDLQQWAILVVRKKSDATSNDQLATAMLLGRFIIGWLRIFHCELHSFLLEPIEGHGRWNGREVFGTLPPKSAHEGKIAVLTRATIRLNKLQFFWQNVAPVAAQMKAAPGFLFSVGIGEIPWIKQATFSIWENKDAMKLFAYSNNVHAEVIKKTRQQKWYSEDMFTRFKILREEISQP